MKGKEDQLQTACHRYMKLQYPDVLAFHIPNGGKRNAIEAKKFKEMGVLAGLPDYWIMEQRREYKGLIIELKAGKNKATDLQQAQMTALRARGFKVHVIYELMEFVNLVNGYLK